MILYLHGFRSSPASHKARMLAARMDALGLSAHFVCPQLPVSPRSAIALCERLLPDTAGAATVVGSSLGGFYALRLAETRGCRAVLVNPAVAAPHSLAELVGTHTNLYTGEVFEFTHDHVAELKALEVVHVEHPERVWLMVETGDEVLDSRQAIAKLAHAKQTVLEGGDHSFTRFPDYLDDILRYAGLLPS